MDDDLTGGAPARFVLEEIASQPDCWRRAIAMAPEVAGSLPQRGQRVAVTGCGTSWFIAQAYAARREGLGHGETDAFVASELPRGRRYDLVLAITRSGTTTEVLDLLAALPDDQPTAIVVGDPSSPGATAADAVVLLDFADERSVVQTRFATTALVLLRAALGDDLAGLPDAGAAALDAGIPDVELFDHVTYLGHGDTVGLAHEAALKLREAAIAHAESYPAFDYRHGPIAVAGGSTLVWTLGAQPPGLADQIRATGATVEHRADAEPLAELVRAQRFAIALALHRGLDPDRPRHLTRSIVLEGPDAARPQ